MKFASRRSGTLLRLSLALIVLLVLPTFAQAQMLLNGSFESPTLPSGTNEQSGGGDDWTTGGSGTRIESNDEGSGDGITPYGQQYLVLPSVGSSDAQTISSGFLTGQAYYLSLAAADYSRSGDELMLSITGGAAATEVFTIPFYGNAGVGGFTIPFKTYGMNFTVTTSAPVTITLTALLYDGGPTNMGVGTYVDNVVLSVPEPRTWAVAALGLAVLSATVCQRRRLAL